MEQSLKKKIGVSAAESILAVIHRETTPIVEENKAIIATLGDLVQSVDALTKSLATLQERQSEHEEDTLSIYNQVCEMKKSEESDGRTDNFTYFKIFMALVAIFVGMFLYTSDGHLLDGHVLGGQSLDGQLPGLHVPA